MPDAATRAHEATHDADKTTQNGAAPKRSPTGGSNEIICEDIKGKQVLHLQAARDLYLRAAQDRFDSTERDYVRKVNGRDTETVWGDALREVFGDQTHFASGSVFLHAKGPAIQMSPASCTTWANRVGIRGSHSVRLSSKSKITLQCGESLIQITPDSIVISAPMVKINPTDGPGLASEAGAYNEKFAANLRATSKRKAKERIARLNEIADYLHEEPARSPAKKTAEDLARNLQSAPREQRDLAAADQEMSDRELKAKQARLERFEKQEAEKKAGNT